MHQKTKEKDKGFMCLVGEFMSLIKMQYLFELVIIGNIQLHKL